MLAETIHENELVASDVPIKVAMLVSEKQPAGKHTIEWNATGFASGVYYYRLQTEAGFAQNNKLMLLK